jgi:hypothetical protein
MRAARPPRLLLAAALLCALAAAAAAQQPPPPLSYEALFDAAGAPDCASDAAGGVDLAASRALALSLATGDEAAKAAGFVVATGVVVAVGRGARCDDDAAAAGGGGGGGAPGPRLDLAYDGGGGDDGDAAPGGGGGDLTLLLYLQCVHWGVASCRRNEDDATSGVQVQQGGGQQGVVDGALARACVVVVRVGGAAAPPPAGLSPCSLAQGGKYTFLLREEREPARTGDACGGQGRYALAGGGVFDSVRPGLGMAACAPWPAWPEPPGELPPPGGDDSSAPPPPPLGYLGALLAGSGGRCPGGLEARELDEGAAWAAACASPPPDAVDPALPDVGRLPPPPSGNPRRGACDPASGVACLPRAACPARMMAGQVLLPGPPADRAAAGGGGGAAYVDRISGGAVPGCGVGYERARAQGVRVKRMRAAQEGGGRGAAAATGGDPPMPNKLGLARLAEAVGAAAEGGGRRRRAF